MSTEIPDPPHDLLQTIERPDGGVKEEAGAFIDKLVGYWCEDLRKVSDAGWRLGFAAGVAAGRAAALADIAKLVAGALPAPAAAPQQPAEDVQPPAVAAEKAAADRSDGSRMSGQAPITPQPPAAGAAREGRGTGRPAPANPRPDKYTALRETKLRAMYGTNANMSRIMAELHQLPGPRFKNEQEVRVWANSLGLKRPQKIVAVRRAPAVAAPAQKPVDDGDIAEMLPPPPAASAPEIVIEPKPAAGSATAPFRLPPRLSQPASPQRVHPSYLRKWAGDKYLDVTPALTEADMVVINAKAAQLGLPAFELIAGSRE